MFRRKGPAIKSVKFTNNNLVEISTHSNHNYVALFTVYLTHIRLIMLSNECRIQRKRAIAPALYLNCVRITTDTTRTQ